MSICYLFLLDTSRSSESYIRMYVYVQDQSVFLKTSYNVVILSIDLLYYTTFKILVKKLRTVSENCVKTACVLTQILSNIYWFFCRTIGACNLKYFLMKLLLFPRSVSARGVGKFKKKNSGRIWVKKSGVCRSSQRAYFKVLSFLFLRKRWEILNRCSY